MPKYLRMRRKRVKLARGTAPTRAERPPGPQRRFRKTVDELLLVFQQRLKAMGLDVPDAEVVAIIRGRKEHGPVDVIVRPWVNAEIGQGVEIV